MPSEVPTSNCEEWIEGNSLLAAADSCPAGGPGGRDGEDRAKGTLELNSVSCSSVTAMAAAAASWLVAGGGGEELNTDGAFEEDFVRSLTVAAVLVAG